MLLSKPEQQPCLQQLSGCQVEQQWSTLRDAIMMSISSILQHMPAHHGLPDQLWLNNQDQEGS